MKSDIQIAQEAELKPIAEIAAQLGVNEQYLSPYGKYKAKIDRRLLKDLAGKAARSIVEANRAFL
ncbi:MAG TPA: formate--tetrahydrofolate ligase, partial [Clostridiales bacterium]|nr:formate--tetrahydrofolate ligase [Clostridiales bacterium]